MFTKKEDVSEVTFNLNLLTDRFTYEIKYLREYMNFSSQSVEERTESLGDQIYQDSIDNPEHEALLQEMFLEEQRAINSYLYHSSIVLVYTVLESTLAQICTEVKFKVKADFSYDGLSGGNIIKKAVEYLKITVGLPFSSIEHIWPRIGQFQNLRNEIVHQNGKFAGKNADTIRQNKNKMLNMFNSLELNESETQFYIMSEHLVCEFIDRTEALIQTIISDIESKTYVISN
ncbi:hypothetical protein AN392_02689 [Pseudoalteromonas sp. P1-16-1b]|uniref:hypothetical protein n=1 Tax=Pseudoalteromonas sp. P1-16-1b TaxID=1723757 RepID=UPI0006D66260|nr:hypothetical protein [Pseudoalteromonas sp. P1-16-1b]KPZ64176.1 hypothetical protein AN392_02689 [Pseudoalteromonas sp. P1-16-1b]